MPTYPKSVLTHLKVANSSFALALGLDWTTNGYKQIVVALNPTTFALMALKEVYPSHTIPVTFYRSMHYADSKFYS